MRWAISVTGLAVGAALSWAGLRQLALLRDSTPRRFPAGHVTLDDRASAWIFVRAGCPHCDSHLRALRRCADDLPSGARRIAWSRLRIVGESGLVPDAVHYPDSLRCALAVRLMPTTWLVGRDGRVIEVWRGTRNEIAWHRALRFLLQEREAP